MFTQSDSVRHEFPLGTSYSSGVLCHVPGFPGLRLLYPIRHPRHWLSQAYLTTPCSITPLAPTPCPGSSPFCVPTLSVSSSLLKIRSLRGFLGSSTHLFLHARPDDSAGSPHPSPSRVLLCCLRCTLKPSASGSDLVEAVPALQGSRPPLRPTGFSVYAYLTILFAITGSSMRSTLDTGGWLTLSRQGLSPRKIRRASPSAITTRVWSA